ncbi:MAG TPA: BON domain-containing protein [Anaerolineales bacterium]|nr:BON domain-containing protein [Anaerolineales bacterium]
MNQINTDLNVKIQDAILTDTQTRGHEIEAFNENGIVTLKGSVPTREISRVAETAVKEIDGVVSVINMLNVQTVDQIKINTNTLRIKK